MNKLWVSICVICLGSPALAQKKGTGKQELPTRKEHQLPKNAAASSPVISLTDRGNYAAKAPGAAGQLSIADPVIRAYNMRSNGANIRLSGSGVMGAPRGTYGFANGQISLRSTDAPSIGGITGSGSVGTGTSTGGVGMGGMVPHVNGKNIYAGPALWGSARNLQLSDSVLRRRPGNK
jgi:hypothetical protein